MCPRHGSGGARGVVTRADLEGAARELAAGVRPREAGGFTYLRTLQAAPRNHGRVDAVSWDQDGGQAAVKRMPNWWMLSSLDEFQQRHPREEEQPWLDVAMLSELSRRGFPYACDFLGVFRDGEWTYAATRLACRGDLFSWAAGELAEPGPAREAAMRPIVAQLFAAARWLHDLDVAHRDLCLENVVVAGASSEEPRVQIIDFGMAALGRMQGTRGEWRGPHARQPYQAPELHCAAGPYDAFLADDFALGVAVYGVAAAGLPWACTEDGRSDHFDLARRCGVPALLRRRATPSGRRLAEALSPELLALLAGLLALPARERLCVGEACFEREGRRSALHAAWLETPAEAQAACAAPCREDSALSRASTADTEAEEAGGPVFVPS